MEEVLGKDKPLVIRRRTRKRAFDECASLDGETVSTVIVPVAAIWVKQSHYPHCKQEFSKLSTINRMVESLVSWGHTRIVNLVNFLFLIISFHGPQAFLQVVK